MYVYNQYNLALDMRHLLLHSLVSLIRAYIMAIQWWVYIMMCILVETQPLQGAFPSSIKAQALCKRIVVPQSPYTALRQSIPLVTRINETMWMGELE